MQKITMEGDKHDDWITGIYFSPYQNLVLTQSFLSTFAFFTVDE